MAEQGAVGNGKGLTIVLTLAALIVGLVIGALQDRVMGFQTFVTKERYVADQAQHVRDYQRLESQLTRMDGKLNELLKRKETPNVD